MGCLLNHCWPTAKDFKNINHPLQKAEEESLRKQEDVNLRRVWCRGTDNPALLFLRISCGQKEGQKMTLI